MVAGAAGDAEGHLIQYHRSFGLTEHEWLLRRMSAACAIAAADLRGVDDENTYPDIALRNHIA